MTSEEPRMSDDRIQAMRRLLAERVRNEPAIRRRRNRRRIVFWGGTTIFVAGALTTGVAVMLSAAPVTDLTIVHCLSSTVANLDGTLPGSSATIADASGQGRVEDALRLCTQMWEQGVLGPVVDPTAPSQNPGPVDVPPLQVCVMRDGTAAVAPGDTVAICRQIRMVPLEE